MAELELIMRTRLRISGGEGHGCFHLKEIFKAHNCQVKEKTSDPFP
jgi:hypothetical protein